MGRGRAKAKQTKVARELKYSSPQTDLEALQRELAGGNQAEDDYKNGSVKYPEHDDYEDEWERHR